MSTIKVNNLQNVSGSSSSTPEQIHAGRAKAWAVFDQDSGLSELNDYNVSSVTDIGTGRFAVNFAVAFPNVNYVASGMSGNRTGNTTSGRDITRDGEWTTSTAYHRVTSGTNTTNDDGYVGVAYFGDE